MFFFIDLTKTIAILLITNSHMGNIYPNGKFAAGGMIGNCLFFLISGYTISNSLKNQKPHFGNWITKRWIRVYASMTVVTVILIALGYYNIKNYDDIIRVFVYPTEFWFLPAIAAFYVPVFFLDKIKDGAKILFILGLILIIYFIQYFYYMDLTIWSIEQTVKSKIVFYFISIYIGISLTKTDIKFESKNTVLLLMLFTFCYLFFNKVIKEKMYYEAQFIVQILGLLAATMLFLTIANLKDIENLISPARNLIKYISSRSLQIYLVQVPLLSIQILQEKSYFPFNFLLMVVLILTLAEILNRLTPSQIMNKNKT